MRLISYLACRGTSTGKQTVNLLPQYAVMIVKAYDRLIWHVAWQGQQTAQCSIVLAYCRMRQEFSVSTRSRYLALETAVADHRTIQWSSYCHTVPTHS